MSNIVIVRSNLSCLKCYLDNVNQGHPEGLPLARCLWTLSLAFLCPTFVSITQIKKKNPDSMLIKFVDDTVLGRSLKQIQTHSQRNRLEVIEYIQQR